MTTRSRRVVVPIAFAAFLAVGERLAAKPTGPVHISASPSTLNMRTGDVVTSTLSFTALEDISRLEATISVIEGLDILSEPTTVVFRDIKEGDVRQLDVRVRLTGAKYGDLSVLYRAIVGRQTRGGGTGITFGNPKN